MIDFFKKLFGSAVKVPAEAPYKVEAPVIQDAPVEGNFTKEQVQAAVKSAKKSTAKPATKPAVKAKTARKPRAPKA
jgi:hypothetical protein